MKDFITIEAGSEAWEYLVDAVENGYKVSIEARGVDKVAVKVNERTWSPTIESVPSQY